MKGRVSNIKIIGILLLFSLGWISCSNNTVFQDSKELPSYGWSKDSVVRFTYNATDTAGKYDIIADIRNTGNYRYQNFWLFINYASPSGKSQSDTLECVLADNYGRWIGKGSGSLFHLPVSFMDRIKFPEEGNYKFEFIQGMREDTLVGIHDIGIRIVRSEE